MNKIFSAVFSLRYLAVFAVIAPFFGAVLMIIFGTKNTIDAYLIYFGLLETEGAVEGGEEAMIQLVASIDHFLYAAILMIFAVGLYALFFKSVSHRSDKGNNESSGMKNSPSWKHLKGMGGMDEMLLKVIIMLLAVSFLEYTLNSGIGTLNWTSLIVPGAIIALAIGLKWMSAISEEEEKDVQPDTKAVALNYYLDALERLANLHEQGALSDEEFESAKRSLEL